MDRLKKNILSIEGIGPKKLKYYNKLGINKIEDFLYNFPRDYQNRKEIKRINELQDGETSSIMATVIGKATQVLIKKNFIIYKLPLIDETGQAYALFYNNPYLNNIFKKNKEAYFFGKIKICKGEIQIIQPDYELVGCNDPYKFQGLIPTYKLTHGITQNEIIKVQKSVLNETLEEIEEYLPNETINRNRLCDIKYAIKNIHFPTTYHELKVAKYRLIFEELLILQLGLLLIKDRLNNGKGIEFSWTKEMDFLLEILPFKLTNSQAKVVEEIREDMANKKSMYRLIHGDVGSGKTVIALIALYNAVLNGFQGALMVPTEILAEQHFATAKELLEPLGVNVKLLTGSLNKKRADEVIEKLKNGNVNIVIGTHALIQDRIEFNNLGLVITDEQHRFGVRQREVLSNKGLNPDILVMTATPIPRTLALILYGDLDISIIDELPPGRKTIKTYALEKKRRGKAYDFVLKQVLKGQQAYIVAPLIEESDAVEANSVEELYMELKELYFNKCNIALLHGRLKSSEKEHIIKEFYSGNIQILVSTTVIEVGVNVPNASLMVIENSERFGLAQLHQLRGRVGRGVHQSYCILINYSESTTATKRSKIMESTNDGFIIAEKDLELRGPGDFFGTKQHGLPELKIANLFRHIKILKEVQNEAEILINEGNRLREQCCLALKNKVIGKHGSNVSL